MLNVALVSSILDIASSVIGTASLIGSRHGGAPQSDVGELTVPWHSFENAEALSLLSWHTHISEFRGRDDEMRELRMWASSEHSVSVKFVTGAGGTGKSRLAAEFAKQLRGRGWAAGFVNLRHPAKFYLKRAGTLLVVDYPEENPAEVRELLGDLASLDGHERWRVLLLTRRSIDDWREAIDDSRATALVAPVPVNLCAVGGDEAYALFLSAQKRAAEAQGTTPLPVPKDAFVAWLRLAPEHNRALFIVALAVHSAFHPSDAVVTCTGREVVSALVDRELARLRRSSRNAGFGEKYALARILASAAISGEITTEHLPGLVGAGILGTQTPRSPELVDRLQEFGVMDGPAVKAPKPDIVAAAFVTRTLAQQPVLAADIIWYSLEQDLVGGIERFCRLSYDAEIVLGMQEPPLSAWLAAAVEDHPDRCRALEPIVSETSLPMGLIDAAVAVWRTLLAAEADETRKAAILNNLSNDLSRSGDWASALDVSRKAVEIHRRLAEVNPGRHDPDLAMSLNNLSAHLLEFGDRVGVLEAIREAVEIQRRLAEVNPDRYESDLTMSLNNLSVHLVESGDRKGGLVAIREAVEIRRRLADVDPPRHEADLAMSLNNLSNHLSGFGDWASALDMSREAVEIQRRLVEVNPARYEPDLTISLNNLSNRLSESGDGDGALAAIREAVEIRRRLAMANPPRYESDLAGSLNNLSNHLGRFGDREGALAVIHEAVDLYRRLADVNPARYEPDLARSLGARGLILLVLGRHRDAAGAFCEGADLVRPYAEEYPSSPLASLLEVLESAHQRALAGTAI